MSLTINSNPNMIDNSAGFNITTSLVEDTDHVNLRVRAEVYHEGIAKATIEKPKGLSDFDFAGVLKSLVPGIKLARNTEASYFISRGGTVGSELITSLAAQSGSSWNTLSTSANAITSAIKSTGVAAYIETNAISVDAGDLLLFFSKDLVMTTGSVVVRLDSDTETGPVMSQNKGILLMAFETSSTVKVMFGSAAGNMNFSGTISLRKITTNRDTVGGALAPYRLKFYEVYENSSGVTQTGTATMTHVYRYVPCDTDSFSSYVLVGDTSKFANETLRNAASKWPLSNLPEYFIVFYTEYVNLESICGYYSNLSAAAKMLGYCYEGWGIFILNRSVSLAGPVNIYASLGLTVAYIGIRQYPDAFSASLISETFRIDIDRRDVSERVILEFDGESGGKEYLSFEGVTDAQHASSRSYLVGPGNNRKPLSLKGVNRQTLETTFKDMAAAEHLKALLASEDVKMLEASYADPTDVTVTTEIVQIDKGREMFTNSIDIEYEH